MTTYEITDRAGPYVAGRRRPKGTTIELTPREAAHELRLGSIRLPAVAEAGDDDKGGQRRPARREP